MLLSFLILLAVAGFVLMILSFYWESLMFSSVTFVIWMGLSVAIHQIELPYVAITSGDTIVTGVQTVENLWMYSMFFMALAIIMFLHMITMVYRLYIGHEKRMM
jgi:hypothetical protein